MPREARRVGVDRPRRRAIEHDEVGRRALDEARRGRSPPARRRGPRAGPRRQRLDRPRERQRARRRPPRGASPSAVSMPLIPFAASPNSTALSTSVCGRVVGGDRVGRAVERAPPGRRPRRPATRSGGLTRSDVAYGAATIAPCRRPTGRRSPPTPSAARRRATRRSARGGAASRRRSPAGRRAFARRTRSSAPAVDTWVRCSRAPGHVADDVGEDREVARDGGLLGRGRPAAQPEDRRDEAVVRLGAVGQGRVLGMVDDRQPERARVGERVPQDRRRSGPARRRRENPTTPGVGQLAERARAVSPARPTVTAP